MRFIPSVSGLPGGKRTHGVLMAYRGILRGNPRDSSVAVRAPRSPLEWEGRFPAGLDPSLNVPWYGEGLLYTQLDSGI
jgi:hypothetical protein